MHGRAEGAGAEPRSTAGSTLIRDEACAVEASGARRGGHRPVSNEDNYLGIIEREMQSQPNTDDGVGSRGLPRPRGPRAWTGARARSDDPDTNRNKKMGGQTVHTGRCVAASGR